MQRPTGPTNPETKVLIGDLKARGYKDNLKFLLRLSRLLEKPRRKKLSTNISKINRYCKEGETAVVPGKLLSSGILTKSVNVAAFGLTDAARQKVEKAGGKVISLRELAESNPKGSNVRIIV